VVTTLVGSGVKPRRNPLVDTNYVT
jgi:hypothetical protein